MTKTKLQKVHEYFEKKPKTLESFRKEILFSAIALIIDLEEEQR